MAFGHQDSWWGELHRRPFDFKTCVHVCQFPFWLKSLSKACYLFTPLTKQPITLLFTGWLISVRAKNALNHSYQHRKQTRNDMADSNISQIKCNYECLSIFIYTTLKCSHSLHEAELTSGAARLALKAEFGRKNEQARRLGIRARRQTKYEP